MRRFTHTKTGFIVLVSVLLLVVGVLALVSHRQASAASTPMATFSSQIAQLDANHCASVTVTGTHFTPSSFTANYALFTAMTMAGKILQVSPAQVAIPLGGNFVTMVTICSVEPGMKVKLTVMDEASEAVAGQEQLRISAPNPKITVNTMNVHHLNDCATVPVFGTGFVPSGSTPNYAYIYGIAGSSGLLSGSPVKVNVLGGGNIAIAAQFCGLAPGEGFIVVARDGVSGKISDGVSIPGSYKTF